MKESVLYLRNSDFGVETNIVQIPPIRPAIFDPPDCQKYSLAAARADVETILLVDEDDESRGVCRSILSRVGFDVLEAASFFKAYNLLRVHGRPKMILTDYWVAGHTTEDFMTILGHHRKSLMEIPIVLMSSLGNLKSRAQKMGIRRILTKPVDAESLIAAVHSLEAH